MTTRRSFLLSAATAIAIPAQTVESEGLTSPLAERELLRGLTGLGLHSELPSFVLRLESRLRGSESYEIRADGARVVLAGATEQAVRYAVYDFLERQGAVFGIDGESYPLDPPAALVVPRANEVWRAQPRFSTRGLLPWPDFLNCISVYSEEDFRAYFEAMARMRFNTFGMHVYTQGEQWAESYLNLEFAGAGHISFLDNTSTHRWGYLPQRTSRFSMGGSEFYDSEVFGADAMRTARSHWEAAEITQGLLRRSFDYAARLSIRTGIGFEPYQIPEEILRALPPEAHARDPKPGMPKFDIESRTARDLLEARLANLLETYPDVEHVWLWEDEGANWESRKTGIPISATPFLQAHAFLRRHAPKKRLVVSGWGGVARHFESLHKRLPGDIVFACLSDSLGWDPIHEVFGKLEGRERWPIPWLEDDPGMWLPQFHVHRFERDMNLAEQYGCQGLIGIHWRHRIVDPTATYQARFSWDKKLAPESHYRTYARTQAAGPRAGRLAQILSGIDRNRSILSTFSGETRDGHAVTREFSGDYNEAFTFWNDYEPPAAVMQSQSEVAAALTALAGEAASARERERIDYLAGHVRFLVPYAEAWRDAHRLHLVLARAAANRADAKRIVADEGVPLWLNLAPRVRDAILTFQGIVATRNDLGTLASMHNKFVRLALVRLRMSMKEYLGELPPQVETLYAQVIRPDTGAPDRLFVPTRPTMLKFGEKVRLLVVAPGRTEPKRLLLHTRRQGAASWSTVPARLLGRRTYEAALGPFTAASPLVEYYVSDERRLTAPLGAPAQVYSLTLT